jgi:hypothetical protein
MLGAIMHNGGAWPAKPIVENAGGHIMPDVPSAKQVQKVAFASSLTVTVDVHRVLTSEVSAIVAIRRLLSEKLEGVVPIRRRLMEAVAVRSVDYVKILRELKEILESE